MRVFPKEFLTRDEIPISTHRSMGYMLGITLPIFAILRGTLLMVGGPDWAGRSLELLMLMFHNAHVVWGGLLLALGICLLAAERADDGRGVWLAGWGCALWCAIAGTAALSNSIQDTQLIDLGGLVQWAFFAILYVLTAQSRIDHDA